MALIYDNIGSYPKSFTKIYISFRTLLVVVYDMLGDFWSSFMTTLVVIQNNLGHCISFRRFWVVAYDIFWRFLVLVYDNIGSLSKII